ncbi:hypothetical protein [Mycobacterium sp. NAZ190054]|uniref:hypothetical protein n=1 Tax=Mycobacterium sp. NAZ190054 TaxID=1747766 RepID=UPI0007990B16|nr:hypothetical protein [Mycobacterium sp. NAZ190054]KWX65489.1 hypothetical protein ASJ79_07885 [Mycobacterium sp. NAZ190054]
MTDRFLTWLSAGALAVGVSAAALAGAGVAVADDDVDPNPTSSQTSPEEEAPSRDEEAPAPDESADASDADADADEAEEPVEEEPADDLEEVVDEVETTVRDNRSEPDPGPESEPDVAVEGDEPAEIETPTTVTVTEQEPSPATARHVMTAPEASPAPTPSLLNVVGSFFWGLFDLAVKLVDFPPAVPPGSTLTAGRSTLQIDCGDGYTADADWYFPTEGEPDKFIYFQHGFPARAGFYNLTLEQLAERNNAIVVAPSITSNIFACDACAMSGEPMQAAVAWLFEGDRAALLASARAAGYQGSLPGRFVITGQSAGASLAVAAAGYYHQLAPAAEKANMVGVLLYEVSAIGGATTGNALANALDKLPDAVPVLNIAAEPNTLNSQGSANAVFTEKRPGQFNGVQLIGGAHSDAFRSSTLFGIPQFLVTVFFGASTPNNVEAVHVLTEGWLTDMYEGRVYDPDTRTGIYGVPGAPSEVVVEIPTTRGPARGYVLPARTPEPSPFDRLINGFFGLLNANYFAACAVAPDASYRGRPAILSATTAIGDVRLMPRASCRSAAL